MLIKCKECELQVSDKAITCPHCGYPLKGTSHKTFKRTKMRLPNGFGQITCLTNRNLRKPYRAMITVGKTETGRPICKILKPNGYFETYNEAYEALVEYNRNPYDLDNIFTVKELYDKWSVEYFKKLSSSSSVRTITSAWTYCGSVENINVRDLRSRHIKGCMDTCKSDNMKRRIKSLFNIMLDYAVEYELVDKNYARDFKTENINTENEHIMFTDEEMAALWKNTSTPFVNMILIACYTGWRPKELCSLKLTDVNINEMIMTGGMKTDAGKNRVVPIHSKILPLVKKIYGMSEMLGSSNFLTCLDGSTMSYDKYNKRFHKIIEELGLDSSHRPHDCRKHFITMCKNANVDEYAIKYIVGHNIDDLTERVYTERSIEWLKTEIEKIQESKTRGVG